MRTGVRLFVLIVMFGSLLHWPAQASVPPAVPSAVVVVPEGNDFATRVLRDPWDMNALSDVSSYLNRSGQANDTQNIQVANGLFSAQSTSTADTNFSVLFPGYINTIKSAKDGALYPIQSSTYRCLHLAMRVDGSNNIAQAMWFKDAALNGGVWGVSNGIFTENGGWRLYSINLVSLGVLSGTPWNGQPTWQGLRIDPSNQANRAYAVDWVRLTDCAAVNTTVNWTPGSGVASIRLRPQGTTRDIWVKAVSSDDGSETLDVQGIQPGTYTVRLFHANGNFLFNANVDTLVVNQAPIAKFVSPSYLSGQDYHAQMGNPLDFAGWNDVAYIEHASATLQNGLLDLVVQPGPLPGGVDAQVGLAFGAPFNGSQYRYLSFRMFTEWGYPWPNVPDSMIVRWIWSIPGVSGAPGNQCHLVSHDIPYDIGWQTVHVDLWDAFNGVPEDSSVIDCPAVLPTWQNSASIRALRFDPNENVTGQNPFSGPVPFYHQLDWIKLTAMDRVSRNSPYRIEVDLNRPASDLTSINYYYTSSPSNPTQHAAQRWSPSAAAGPFRAFMPIIGRGPAPSPGDTLPQADVSYLWNTSQVSPGIYYVCAEVTMGPNTATYCSQAPVQVY